MIFGILPQGQTLSELPHQLISNQLQGGLQAVVIGPLLHNERMHTKPGRAFFTSEDLIFRHNDSFQVDAPHGTLTHLLPQIQNVVACMEFSSGVDGWKFTASSGRIGRARIFYTAWQGGFLFSNDLRDLIPFTNRKLHPAAVYSVLKFGDVPEHLTVVRDIHTVPVGQYFEVSNQEWPISVGTTIARGRFKFYYRLVFPMDGGNVDGTRRLLESEFALIAKMNPMIPVSGGVDSTLINRLVNMAATEAYPAYFVQFGNDDPEREFAKRAVQGTKAELEMCVFTPKDTIPSFEFQTRHLIQPIGESSTISTANFFRNFSGKGHRVIDGTLADGCYGSANYGRSVLEGISEKPQWQMRLNEQLSVFLRLNGLPGKDRFHPRDSMIQDPLFRFMSMYVGPYANVLFNGAEAMNSELEPLWTYYYDYLGPDRQSLDEWMMYSVFKMVNYASKNNTAKSFDMARPNSSGIYPFMWLAVLQDQGHYTWAEKVPNGIFKFPLKKILEDHMPHDFVYRKKVGLNSCFEDWIYSDAATKQHFIDHLTVPSGVAEALMGRSAQQKVIKAFSSGPTDIYMAHLVINLAILQGWATHHKLSF